MTRSLHRPSDQRGEGPADVGGDGQDTSVSPDAALTFGVDWIIHPVP